MLFDIERMELSDSSGTIDWNRTSGPRVCGTVAGADASAALAAVVLRDGAVQLGVAASYVDGQAVMLAQKDGLAYALRALPRSGSA
jgi:hypothetical protein